MEETAQGVSTPDCPYCDRPVDAVAEQCPHCGAAFFEGKAKDGRLLTPYGASGQELYADFALLLLLFLILSVWSLVAVGLFGHGKVDLSLVRTVMYRLQFEGGLIMTVLLALLVGIEASRLGVGNRDDLNRRNIRRSGPVHWFILTLFVWPISLLAYLSWRSRYGVKNRFISGLILVVALFGSVYGAGTIMNNHPAFRMSNISAPEVVVEPEITVVQAEAKVRTTILNMKRALEDTFFQRSQYPVTTVELFSGFGSFEETGLTLVYVSGGPDYYQLIVYHEKGENDFLVRTGDSEIYTFAHSDVVADLTKKYGAAAIRRKGNLYFVVNQEN